MGFWPAVLALSALFGALHYLLKPDETWIDGASTGLLGLLLFLSIRRTGDICLAAGFHFGAGCPSAADRAPPCLP